MPAGSYMFHPAGGLHWDGSKQRRAGRRPDHWHWASDLDRRRSSTAFLGGNWLRDRQQKLLALQIAIEIIGRAP